MTSWIQSCWLKEEGKNKELDERNAWTTPRLREHRTAYTFFLLLSSALGSYYFYIPGERDKKTCLLSAYCKALFSASLCCDDTPCNARLRGSCRASSNIHAKWNQSSIFSKQSNYFFRETTLCLSFDFFLLDMANCCTHPFRLKWLATIARNECKDVEN